MNPLYMLGLVFAANILIKAHRKSQISRPRKPVQDIFTSTDRNQNLPNSVEGGSGMGKNNNPYPPE